jgi:hypothetical protein
VSENKVEQVTAAAAAIATNENEGGQTTVAPAATAANTNTNEGGQVT